MPRQGRIEIVGSLYHVISRGIERKKIFSDNQDREEFVRRFNKGLEETNCMCYAWVLMDNHFHLLLKPLKQPISQLMRKLLSGYVGYYNARHKRVGHLFQNRYKSILCQEDVYLKELIRYIHLNPVRSKRVETIAELKSFCWSSHPALLGKKLQCIQYVEEVLGLFGDKKLEARKSYLKFLKEGWYQGYKKEYSGGGLLRSVGGMKGIRLLKRFKEKWQYDSRILGSGDFVEQCLKDYDDEEQIKLKIQHNYTIETLSDKICQHFKIAKKELYSGRRYRSLSLAKGVLAYIATEYLNHTLNGTTCRKCINLTGLKMFVHINIKKEKSFHNLLL